MQQRQRESRGLAGTCLRSAQHVPPLEHQRDRLSLDRRGLGVTLLGNRLEQLRQEIQVSKAGQTKGQLVRVSSNYSTRAASPWRASAQSTCSRTSAEGWPARVRSAATTPALFGALPRPTARLRS